MTQVALLPSVLGLRLGVVDAADVLRDAGHDVLLVDYHQGEMFDDYPAGTSFVDALGDAEVVRRALDGVAGLDDGFVVGGFSLGSALAQYVALHRPVRGALLFAGAASLAELGGTSWPAGVPVQVHYALGDPFREDEELASFVASVQEAGATVETFDYPGEGHLFTDASLPEEYDAEATALLWSRVLEFLDALE